MRKHLPILIFIFSLLALILGTGCGGGGGGGSSDGGDGGGTGGYSRIQIVAVENGKFIDPMNLKPGQTAQLQFIGFNAQNQAAVLNGTNWRTNAPANVATVSTSGQVTAVGASANTFTVTGTFAGRTFTANLGVRSNIATLTGKVQTANGTGVGFGELVFYNFSGQIVGRTRINADGTYRAQVPASARSFVWDYTDVKSRFLAQFNFSGEVYSSEVADCQAPLQTLTAGQTRQLTDILVVAVVPGSPPPPPPGGCWQG